MDKGEKLMDNFKVYVHTTPDGKRYVGVTSIEPKKRNITRQMKIVVIM